MFITRRILGKNKPVANFICTNNVLNCNEPKDKKDPKNIFQRTKKKKESITRKLSPNNSLNKVVSKVFQKPTDADRKTKNEELEVYEVALKKEIKNVAKELRADENNVAQDIMNYLKEFKVSKDLSNRSTLNDIIYEEESSFNSEAQGKFFFSFKPLNIFKPKKSKNTKPQVKLNIWDDLEAEELQYVSKLAPKNCFEEMIKWTEEGKLWRFPIDNDQGMEKEAENSFTDHIFLEQYLEPWCPKGGPLRKFMQLVLIGLSKNYIYTIEEKKAHIEWFRKYFDEKRKLLEELGAVGAKKEIGGSNVEENEKS